MQVNIFSIPIFIGNIDTSKLKFKEQKYEQAWHSQTPSSYKQSKDEFLLEDESSHYLNEIIRKVLLEKLKVNCKFGVAQIWTNKYEKNDYQEEHIHSGHQFSFIIYSNIQESKTVFISEYRSLNESFKLQNIIEDEFNVECRSNQIIIFPSFLKHRVDRLDHSGETIAGNINIEWQK